MLPAFISFPLGLGLGEGGPQLLPKVIQVPGPAAVGGVHVVDENDAEAEQVEEKDGRHVGDGRRLRVGVDLVQLVDVVGLHVLMYAQLL